MLNVVVFLSLIPHTTQYAFQLSRSDLWTWEHENGAALSSRAVPIFFSSFSNA